MKAKLFIFKLALFFIPFIISLGFYIWTDPFKVIWKYESYFDSEKLNVITLNKDFVSTQNWLNHYPQFGYDSYIFGNSRSMFYEVSDWRKYIDKSFNKCYHFDASGESLYGIEKKFNFLDKRNAKLTNALIIIDDAILNQVENSNGHIFVKSPKLSHQNYLKFQFEFVKAFFDFDFFRAYIDYRMSGQIKGYMKEKNLLDDTPYDYNFITNELKFNYFENQIQNNPKNYYKTAERIFYFRDSTSLKISSKKIGDKQVILLKNIKTICDKNKTRYKIIISPLYEQNKINPEDVLILNEIFGENNVFDFSGINNFTRNIENYYETSHYRPHVAREIMKIVYMNSY